MTTNTTRIDIEMYTPPDEEHITHEVVMTKRGKKKKREPGLG